MLLKDSSRNATNEAQGGASTTDASQAEATTGPQSIPEAATPSNTQAPLVPIPTESSMLPHIAEKNTTTRGPVFVPGTGKKSGGILPPKKGPRSVVVNAGVAVLLVAIVVAALAAVLPTGNGQASGLLQIFNPSSSVVKSTKNDTALIAAQAATATAVTQDGYDNGNQSYAGVQSAPVTTVAPSDAGSLNRFFYGQCTYWANMRYHELTGHWVPWLGNAGEWSYQASSYGWQTSSYPNPNGPSIIVLAPGVQGAGGYGHVAVVETGISAASAANGVSTSNWNWNGDWAKEDWVTFYPGSGVTFVWY